MNYNIINSSSDGNAIVVEKILLLDCGIPYTKLKQYLKHIKLVFISHCHKDHLLPSTISKIAYNYPTIKFVVGSEDLVKRLVECGIRTNKIIVLPEGKWFDMGAVKVKLEPLVHDVDNHCLKFEINKKKGIYIVDTSNVDNIKAQGYDLYLIENNYREDILKKHIDECEDENKMYYLSRVSRTHLSDEQCNSFLIENMKDNGVYEYIHQSSYNFENRED